MIFLGDLLTTAPQAAKKLNRSAVFAHYEMSTTDLESSLELAALAVPHIHAMMVPGGIMFSSLPLEHASWESVPVPSTVKPGRYFIYKAGA